MHASSFFLLALLPGLLLRCGEASPPTTAPLFEEVTTTHLPRLDGPTMDARPVDVDADGDLDLVLAMEFAPNVLLLNDGTGRFTDASDRLPRTRHDSEDIAAADFDGDGDPDLFVTNRGRALVIRPRPSTSSTATTAARSRA